MIRRWATIGASIGCMVMVALATAATARIMQPVIDGIFVANEGSRLLPIALLILAIFMVKGFAMYGQSLLTGRLVRFTAAELQIRMVDRLVRSDLATFHDTASGRLISRFTYDAQAVQSAIGGTLTALARDSLTLIALVAVMFWLDWRLAAIAFVVFPLTALPIIILGRKMRRVSDRAQTQMGDLTARLSQLFQGIRHVKADNAETREAARSETQFWKAARIALRQTRVRATSRPINETLGGLAIMLVVLFGGQQVIAGNSTPGAFFAFLTAVILAYEPLKKLAMLNTELQRGLAAADRIFAVIDSEPEIYDRPGAATLQVKHGHIRFERVHFAYRTDMPTVRDVSLDVPAGQTVAVVGPSGAGKSTLLDLIPRFFDASGGRILIDDQDIRDVTLASLRAHIALVSQEPNLFDDTVAANIAFGRPGASRSEIEAAAAAAGAHDFIVELAEGYETVVGEHAVRLSGGQRQRLAIARAMLKNAPILLLDEATSALDTESEQIVQAALRRLMQGRTTLVVTHRLSTVRDADLIYVLEDGGVVEQGSHGELIARRGLYAHLWTLQTADTLPPLTAVDGGRSA